MSKLPEVDNDSVSQTTTIAAAPASPLLAADVDQGRDICKVSLFFNFDLILTLVASGLLIVKMLAKSIAQVMSEIKINRLKSEY